MDYAGGSVVHVTSGTTALILALMLGPRIDYDGEKEYYAHSPTYVYLGTGLLWFGWMGFNGGSSVAANSRGVNAAFTSNLAASAGGVTWMILDTTVNQKKYTAIGLCTGAIAGLAAVTPGSGFVQPGVGIIFGIISAICCFYSVKLMKKLRIDDTLDVAPVHGVGGAVGMLLTGVFAQYQVTQVDITPGVEPTAGWLDVIWESKTAKSEVTMTGLTPDKMLQLFPNDELPEDSNFPRWMPGDGEYGPGIPTGMHRVQLALQLAGTKPGDHVLDLGCGDGRFCVAAVSLFGAESARGIDVDKDILQLAQEKTIEASSMSPVPFLDKISYIHGDLRDSHVKSVLEDPKTNVLIAFLTPEFSVEFKDLLVDKFNAGCRIVAVTFDLANI
ncbi:hypothetical protein HDU99_002694, partial [Rhizoclosmatium hyalinum]